MGSGNLFHYTNGKGFKAISSQVVWLFKASKPPGIHPKGAYFSTLPPDATNLGKRLFVRGCKEKIRFYFSFLGGEDLSPLKGGRGSHVFFSEVDYPVVEERQGPHGERDQGEEDLK